MAHVGVFLGFGEGEGDLAGLVLVHGATMAIEHGNNNRCQHQKQY